MSKLLWITTVFSTGSEAIDSAQIIIPIRTLQKYLRYDKNEYSLLALILRDQNLLEQTKKSFSQIMTTNNSGSRSLTGAKPK